MSTLHVGIDAGSVSAKITIIDDNRAIVHSAYALHHGDPFGASARLAAEAAAYSHEYSTLAVTGSARKIVGRASHADIVKNEITALWRAVTEHYPDARTVIEIGGQDSKILSLRDGDIDMFRLNSVCAAGTGSFIQQQAARLGISIEELSALGMRGSPRARFTGRCTVFVETEMVNLQQRGYPLASIAAGLSSAVCENYLKDLSPGVRLEPPFIFCGGVARIESIVAAFSERLGHQVIRPDFYQTAGAYGAALLAYDESRVRGTRVSRGIIFDPVQGIIPGENHECTDCFTCGKCFDTHGTNR